MKIDNLIVSFILSFVVATAALAASAQPSLQQGGAMYGAGQYSQGHWAQVKSVVINPASESVSPLLTVSTKRAGNLQFATRCWVPPESKIVVITPVYPTRLPKKKARAINLKTQLVTKVDGHEQILDTKPSLVTIAKRKAMTAVIGGNDNARNLVKALRQQSGWDKSSLSLRAASVPTNRQMLGLIKTIVLGKSNFNLSEGQIFALRNWILAGGKVWIMLDKTGLTLPSRLLQDKWDIAKIDTTELTNIAFTGSGASTKIRSDYPFQLVRVTAPGMQVLAKANGYPAVLSMKMGKGAVYITTLQAKALIKIDSKNSHALGSLAKFFRPQGFLAGESGASNKATYASLKDYSRGQIGYKILGRLPVIIVLGVLVILLIIIATIFYFKQALEIAAALGCICAVIAAIVLMGLGFARQSQTPTTLSTANLVKVDDNGYSESATISAAIYRPPAGSLAGNLRLEGKSSLPDISTLRKGSGLVRLIFDGDNHWYFQGVNLSSGAVHTITVSQNRLLQSPRVVTAHFTGAGIEGNFKNIKASQLSDVIIANQAGAVSVHVSNDKFSAGENDELTDGQYIAGGILSSDQIAHQKVYRSLLTKRGFLYRPMLLGWKHTVKNLKTSDASAALSLSKGATDNRATLYAFPINFQKSKPGSKVSLPAAFLPMAPYRGKGAPSNTIYDPRRHVWNPDINRPQTVIMQYAIPKAVLPLKLSSVTVQLHLLAPGRAYKIVTWRNGHSVTLFKGESLTGKKTIHLGARHLPVVNSQGAILLGIHVGANEVGTRGSGWSIRKLKISAKGTVSN